MVCRCLAQPWQGSATECVAVEFFLQEKISVRHLRTHAPSPGAKEALFLVSAFALVALAVAVSDVSQHPQGSGMEALADYGMVQFFVDSKRTPYQQHL
jgi:hypothetical protein